MGVVYLLHFNAPYFHARHYLGYTEDLPGRIKIHNSGNGSPLIRSIVAAGIGFELARTWLDKNRTYERRIKDQHNAPRFCPICNPETYKEVPR